MSNNGTPYDKYFRGWRDEGDPPYARSMRDDFAIRDSIESHEDDWEPCDCEYLWEEPCPYGCDDPRTVEQRKLEARGKYEKKINDPGGPTRRSWRWYSYSRYNSVPQPEDAEPQEGCSHVWQERERWYPRMHATYTRNPHARGWIHGTRTSSPMMVLSRYWRCTECRGEQNLGDVRVRPPVARRWVRGENVVREMTPSERKAWDEGQAKQAAKLNRGGTPKTYGEKEDGSPIYRNEFKQAPPKREVRKRPDEEE